MDLHGQIMNIQPTSANIGKAIETGISYDNDWESRLALAYNMGHCDARHAAAKLVTNQQVKTDNVHLCGRPGSCAKGNNGRCYSGFDCHDKVVAMFARSNNNVN